MTQAKVYKRRAPVRGSGAWGRVLKGLIVSIAVTGVCVLVFALLMQWLRPADGTIRVINQVIKLGAILAGVWTAVGRGGENGLLRGVAVGLLYMGLGVAVYALLTGQQLPMAAYLADLGMGVAGGGIAGIILSNLNPAKS